MKTSHLYKEIRGLIKDVRFHENETYGIITLNNRNLELIKQAYNANLVSSELVSDGKTILIDSTAPNNKEVQVKLISRISQDLSEYYISEDDSGFYSKFSYYFTQPKDTYIHSLFSDPNFDESLFYDTLHYTTIIFSILSEISDYHKDDIGYHEFFLYATKPLIIKTHFKKLESCYIKESDETFSFIKEDKKSSLYKSFLKLQIINLLENIPESDRFQTLLSNFKTVYTNFTESIELYFKEFDLQKNISEIEGKKIDLVKKIHTTVNEIGNKIITIPLAFLLILKELKFEHPFNNINWLFFSIAIVYSSIIETSISNQFGYLKILNTDKIDFLALGEKTPELENKFKVHIKDINKSIETQRAILWTTRISNWLLPLLILALIIYLKNTQT